MSGTPQNAPDLKTLIAKVGDGTALSATEAQAAFNAFMSGAASPVQMAAFLMALRVRGETVEEITGGARAMRAHALAVEPVPGAIDTCGTGGDAKGTYNVSTAVAFVTAACGVKVAKHGNKAASSKSGSAEVLEALGVRIDLGPTHIRAAILDAGLGFMPAMLHHQAMRHVMPVRQELGMRTVFNLLGPLSNPAGAKRQLLGVFDGRWVEPLAHVLKELGTERAWVVHGEDGLDELTTTGPSFVAALDTGHVRSFEVTPEEAGLPRASLDDLKGGTPQENASALRAVLDGTPGAYRDIVVLNTAAALMVAGKAHSLREGAGLAAAALDEGRARAVLERLVTLTNQDVPKAEV